MVAGGFVLSLAACGTRTPEPPTDTVVRVRTMIADVQEVVSPIRTSGKLASRTESRLGFKTGGIIMEILVREGQNVGEGQLLARLNLEEIESQVRQAGFVLEKAERDHARALNLYRDSVATLEQLQNSETALEVARSNARIADFNLSFSTIRAPSQGKILKRVAEENEIISPGYPVFIFASTQGDWIVRSSLTDQDVVRVNMLDSALISFDAYPGEVFRGLVSETGTAADPYTGTYEIEIQLVRKPARLVSGLIANIRIFPSETEKKIILPMESLVEGTGLTGYVYVLESDRPVRREVSLARLVDEGMVVESGIGVGDEVVIQGARYLDPESRIRRLTDNP